MDYVREFFKILWIALLVTVVLSTVLAVAVAPMFLLEAGHAVVAYLWIAAEILSIFAILAWASVHDKRSRGLM